MNDVSDEMKTESDFIERAEASGSSANAVTPESPAMAAARAERERMQQEMVIKAKKENKSKALPEEPINKPIEDLQPREVDVNINTLNELAKTAKIEPENSPVKPVYAAVVEPAPWDEPKEEKVQEQPIINDITLNITADISEKPVVQKPSKKAVKEVDVVSATEAAAIQDQTENESKIGKELIEDDIDQRVREENLEIRRINETRLADTEGEELTSEKIIETFNNNYEDSEASIDDENKIIELVSESSSDPKVKEAVNTAVEAAAEEREHKYYGGDGKQTSFKIRTAKVAKVLRNIKVADTDTVTATDISKKTQKEQQNIYMTTVLPTLQPSYSVVPFVVSGVVITMTAFNWTDIKEICKIDEKVDDLDPSSEDYIYNKNLIFLEKREKQLDIFYRHIYSVSGFEVKPSKHKLYSEVIKFPDFQQLFFAAYAATFQKPTAIGLTCATCGATHDLMVGSKDLCFLLNKHIDIDKLNRYIDKGAISGSSTAEIYAEFQKEKIVESANKIFRIKEKLPNSSFIYELQVPYVEQAYTALSEIIEKFRDKSLEYVDADSEQMVSIDSSFGLTDDLLELRKYLYLKALLVPQIISEDSNSAKVSYLNFTDLDGIIDSVYQLSPEDYNVLMNDPRLNSIMNISGIRHLIDGKQCPEEACKAELGLLPVEPETLFFMIARRK